MRFAPPEDIASAFWAAILARINGGGSAGRLRLYSGQVPAAGAAITTQTVVFDITLAYPAEASITGRIVTLAPIVPATCLAADPIAFGRFEAADGTWAGDIDIGLTGADVALQLDQLSYPIGAALGLTVLTLSLPA